MRTRIGSCARILIARAEMPIEIRAMRQMGRRLELVPVQPSTLQIGGRHFTNAISRSKPDENNLEKAKMPPFRDRLLIFARSAQCGCQIRGVLKLCPIRSFSRNP